VRFPPRETWTQAQRDAADRLVEILLPHAYLEAAYVIQAEIEREGTDSKIPEAELETIATTRGIALSDAGKWRQRDTLVHFPPSWIRQILEMFARGDLSLLNPTQPKQPTPRARRLRSLRSAYSSLTDALSPMRFGDGPLRLAFGTSWLSQAALVIPDRVADHMEMDVGPAF
jgi:hypothetical protein